MKINELIVGKTCDITLVVKSASARETKAKKPYLSLELFDGTDTISANYWDWCSDKIPEVNAIVDVQAQVTEWQGKKQLNVKSLRKNTTRHLAEFMPTADVDLIEVYSEAYALVIDVDDDMLRDLALAVLDEMRDAWLTVPAASGVHHAYTGGTLVHSCSVAKIAKAIASKIPEANEDLCVVGALLHDIGKLFTYKLDGISISVTDDGQLYDHIFMGAEFIGNFAESHVDCDDYGNAKKLQLLRHIILSHHGVLEYGSPVVPACIEAHIVHSADSIDAITEQVRVAARKTPKNVKWTERIYTVNNKAQLTPAYIAHIMGTSNEDELVHN